MNPKHDAVPSEPGAPATDKSQAQEPVAGAPGSDGRRPAKPADRGRLLGIDYGNVRIGLAITDPDRIIASPLATYERASIEEDAGYFRQLMIAERVAGLVLGLPMHTDGREGQKAAEVRKFGAWLASTTGLPLVYWDERFTTVDAENALWNAGMTHRQRKARRDRVAAQMLLMAYLAAGCPVDVVE